MNHAMVLLRAGHAGANDSREFLLANAVQQADGHPDDGNNTNGESEKEPKRHADVLLGACCATPVRRSAIFIEGRFATADETNVPFLGVLWDGTVFVHARSMARAVARASNARLVGAEARRNGLLWGK